MRRWTVDASIVLSRLLDDERPRWVDDVIADIPERGSTLVAPSLLWLEVGNRLARSEAISDEFALEAMIRAEALVIEQVHITRPLRLRALALARQHRLTMYDAIYLAVAEATDARLLTLDARLEGVAAMMGLGRDGGVSRVTEPPARYGRQTVDTRSLSAIGAAIAEMRRQYSAQSDAVRP